jgi:hypothetical protein
MGDRGVLEPAFQSRRPKGPVVLLLRFVTLNVAGGITAWLLLEWSRRILPQPAARVLVGIVMLIIMIFLASQAGYRPLRALVLSWVPFYGGIFVMKVLWRVANLPNRYWDPSHRSALPVTAGPRLDEGSA